MNIGAIIGVSLALAFLSESLTEYIFGTLTDHVQGLSGWKWALMYVALAVGVGLAFYYRLDLIALIAQPGAGVTPVGHILTGLVIGRGANYLHQFVSQYFPKVTNL